MAIIERMSLRPSERAVVSLLACDGVLTHASLLFGPRRMVDSSWPEWQIAHGLTVHLHHGGIPATFVHNQGRWTIARIGLTQAAAGGWLAGALDGVSPAVAGLPEFRTSAGEPYPVLIARQHNRSPASQLATASPRPVTGVFVPLEASVPPAPLEWPVGNDPHWLLTLLGLDAPTDPEPEGRLQPFVSPALLVARVSRRAWINDVRFRPDEGLQVDIRREPDSDPDLYGLVLELNEGARDELFDSRRLALADVRLPAKAVTRATLRVPTLGLGLQRSLQLYSRAGDLVDRRDPFGLVEAIHIRVQVAGSRAAPTTVTIGNRAEPPSLPQRLQALRDVDDQWEWWRGHGLRYRVVTEPRDVRRYLRQRLRRARSDILVIDPYFGTKDVADWDVVVGLRATVRVLTGSSATRPAGGASGVLARKWPTAPPPYHDRLWLVDGRAGMHVGASVSGLDGRRAFRVSEIDPPEVTAWIAAFETWWSRAAVI